MFGPRLLKFGELIDGKTINFTLLREQMVRCYVLCCCICVFKRQTDIDELVVYYLRSGLTPSPVQIHNGGDDGAAAAGFIYCEMT